MLTKKITIQLNNFEKESLIQDTILSLTTHMPLHSLPTSIIPL